MEHQARRRTGGLHARRTPRSTARGSAQRYKDTPNIIWILGGDRPIETDAHKEIIRAMARGLRAGDGGAHLMTFHPPGANSSSTWFHDEPWLDFNMRQNGHAVEFTGRYDQTRVDYDRTPIKPVLDGEPVYEDHPVSFDAKKSRTLDFERRAPAALLGSLQRRVRPHLRPSLGVADVDAGAAPINNPLLPWYEAIDQPGAAQMQHGRALIESRPFLTRIPDPDIIVTGRGADERARRGTLPVHVHARRERQLRDGLRAGRPAVHRADERDHRDRR